MLSVLDKNLCAPLHITAGCPHHKSATSLQPYIGKQSINAQTHLQLETESADTAASLKFMVTAECEQQQYTVLTYFSCLALH